MQAVTLKDYKQRVLRVLDYIQAHLDEPLPVDALANVACLSPYHFHRVFTGMTGETMHALVRRLRLERAAWQLNCRSDGILEVALAAGYESHEAFSRAFARAYTQSPSAFRRLRLRNYALPARSRIHYEAESHRVDFRSVPYRPFAMKVSIQTLPARRVACVRHVGPYATCGLAWDQLTSALGATGDLGPGTQMMGISYDDPDNTPPEALRYDAAITVTDDFEPPVGITVREVTGGEYAVLTHQGSYRDLGRSYRHLMGTWLPRSGRELADTPCFEIYLTDPDSTAAADLLTDIHAPLIPLTP
ncbi:AraC family transcriptional regulator [Synoicihabitans lomoniglobus]|uniref:AraC family transcriptional regulator n=1 Tax=Synoicihabitans lomoniglobus TaxID=2909285 RepID=A0AAF0I424_9BACT|nr:AraC family transcriptional regulator [Opitutaceae bacterium LMO-M01]WED66509.1 AraC family transcriptional regulator [Opitutaceae bacterium LMO-M01]